MLSPEEAKRAEAEQTEKKQKKQRIEAKAKSFKSLLTCSVRMENEKWKSIKGGDPRTQSESQSFTIRNNLIKSTTRTVKGQFSSSTDEELRSLTEEQQRGLVEAIAKLGNASSILSDTEAKEGKEAFFPPDNTYFRFAQVQLEVAGTNINVKIKDLSKFTEKMNTLLGELWNLLSAAFSQAYDGSA